MDGIQENRTHYSLPSSPDRLFRVDISLREPLLVTYTFSGDEGSGVRHYLQLKTSSKTVVLLDPNATPAAGESSQAPPAAGESSQAPPTRVRCVTERE